MLVSLKLAVLFMNFAVFGDDSNPQIEYDCSSAPPNNISCHNIYITDDLPTADKWEFPEKSIFFVETSCKGGLNSRQACTVESAALAHPLRQVNVLFAGPVQAKCHENPAFLALKSYGNVNFLRIHPKDLAKRTPLEDFLTDWNPLELSEWPVSHASDILRYLILYKWRGVYLDLDMMVLKPFDGLAKNWAAKEMLKDKAIVLASGALAFSGDALGREVAAAAIEQLKADFREWNWGYNGPGVIFRTLRRLCKTNNPEGMSAEKCQGFEVYDYHLFYPVIHFEAMKLFFNGHVNLGSAYTCHFWGSRTYYWIVRPRSPYLALAERYCPRIFDLFGSSFGSPDEM